MTAIPNEPAARVSISLADADANTAGHQVALAEGNNAIAVTVTAPNGNRRAYTIAVRRALPPPPPTPPKPTPQPNRSLAIRKAGNFIEIRWISGTLQSAYDLSGPWANVAGVQSPLRVDPIFRKRFFRLKPAQESAPTPLPTTPSPPPFETR